MLRQKLDKKTSTLSSTFEPILVCNNQKLRPYLEITVEEPENIDQYGLGTFLGVFEIAETSEDSSYVVNYLISVIKKEYFSRPKRGPVESFEAALKKGNLALSKLAEHGSINWIGKLNAVCAVIEKNKLHFTRSGTASVLLLRAKSLTDISEGLSPEEIDPNPLKTFDNISSGRIESGDKLIITTDGIFDIFSFEEIKKSAVRFSNAEFVQFLKTALGNQLEKAAILVIESQEKELAPKILPASPEEEHQPVNFFSQSAFEKNKKSVQPRIEITTEVKQEILKESEQEENENKKNNHLYIKEADHIIEKNDQRTYSDPWMEKIKHHAGLFGSASARISSALVDKSAALAKRKFHDAQSKIRDSHKKIPRDIVTKEKLRRASLNARNLLSAIWQKIQPILLRIIKNAWHSLKKFSILIFEFSIKTVRHAISKITAEKSFSAPQLRTAAIPNFSRIKKLFSSFTYEQRLYAALAFVAVFILPYFYVQYEKSMAEKNVVPQVQQETQPVALPLAQDKNVSRVENITTKYESTGIKRPINLNGKIFAVTQSVIFNAEDNSTSTIPPEIGPVTLTTGMDDLNLIFLINTQTKKIYSWSPFSKKFQDNAIILPDNANIATAETYLTYIYLMDTATNQIYRYPRAEGGFGLRTDWLKDSVDLSGPTGMSVAGNIFSVNGKNIQKFTKGALQNFQIEGTATPISPFKIYSRGDNGNIYILDKQNSRLIKTDSSGNIITQYYHSEINVTDDFTINEETSTAFLTTPQKMFSFQII
jgi:hypothetical protein